jgi:hypothetical protein
MMPDLDLLVANARETIRPYRWLVKQSRCRACGNVHEREPLLMREVPSGWAFEATDDGSHNGAPVVFEEIVLAWCEACNTKAACELTRELREIIDVYANTTALASRVERALVKYDAAKLKEHFHHA